MFIPMSPKLTLFCQTSVPGLSLGASVVNLSKRLQIDVDVRETGDCVEFRIACCQSLAVIIDLSVESEGHNTYNILIDEHRQLDHVLIVSRTHLPINVNPPRVGGAPPYPFPDLKIPGYQWSNSDILAWLEKELQELLRNPVNHPIDLPLQHPGFPSEINKNLILMIRDAERKKRKKQAANPIVFLSYRGRYYQEVQKLAVEIKQGKWHPGETPEVVILTPGQLALEWEYLPEGRRWQVLGMLEDLIGRCSEVWIYQSDDYLDSWWTIGELVCTRYAQYMWSNDDRWLPGPQLRLFDPKQKQVLDDIPDAFFIPFGLREREHLDRMLGIAAQAELDFAKIRGNALFARWYKVLYKIGLGGAVTKLFRKIMIVQSQQTMDHMPEEDHDGFRESAQKGHDYWSDPKNVHFQLSNPLYQDDAWVKLGTTYHEQFLDTTQNRVDLDRFFDCSTRLKSAVSLDTLKNKKEIITDQGDRLPIAEYPPRRFWEGVDDKPARLLVIPTFAAK